jgi:hypothetical protein
MARSFIYYNIEGLQSIDNILHQLPEKYGKKPIIAAFRRGAKIYLTSLQKTSNATSSLKSFIKAKATKGIGLLSGIYGEKPKGKVNDYIPEYFKYYWKNYGTLTFRASNHQFKYRRRARTSKWKGGIKPVNFAERSWAETKDKVQETIEKELESETLKFLNKHKVNE